MTKFGVLSQKRFYLKVTPLLLSIYFVFLVIKGMPALIIPLAIFWVAISVKRIRSGLLPLLQPEWILAIWAVMAILIWLDSVLPGLMYALDKTPDKTLFSKTTLFAHRNYSPIVILSMLCTWPIAVYSSILNFRSDRKLASSIALTLGLVVTAVGILLPIALWSQLLTMGCATEPVILAPIEQLRG